LDVRIIPNQVSKWNKSTIFKTENTRAHSDPGLSPSKLRKGKMKLAKPTRALKGAEDEWGDWDRKFAYHFLLDLEEAFKKK
jgi:hypothetical protein